MNQLVFKNNDQVVTSSRNIARDFDKGHREVLRSIDNIIKGGVVQDCTSLFHETTYVHEQNNQEFRQYLMNRDGFTLLVMGFTGRKAMQFKMKYIEAFNKMENQLKQQTIDMSQLSPELQAFGKIFESMAQMQLEQKETVNRVDNVEQSQKAIREILGINDRQWRDNVNKILNTIARKNGGIYKQIRQESYSRLESRGRCDLGRRLENKIRRLERSGATKTKINNASKLDVIDADQRLKEIYLSIVREMAIEFGVEKEVQHVS